MALLKDSSWALATPTNSSHQGLRPNHTDGPAGPGQLLDTEMQMPTPVPRVLLGAWPVCRRCPCLCTTQDLGFMGAALPLWGCTVDLHRDQ